MDNQLFTMINERMNKMEEKIDKILQFKWQIVGGSFVASAVITLLAQIIIAVIKN